MGVKKEGEQKPCFCIFCRVAQERARKWVYCNVRLGVSGMGEVCLLDCTLRDGGYVNDWRFGTQTMQGVVSCLDAAGVQIVELGFLDGRCGYEAGRSMQPSVAELCEVYGKAQTGRAMRVAMIDYGTMELAELPPAAETGLEGIRVIFKKEQMIAALRFCEGVAALGYRVFAQAVSITAYTDRELGELCTAVNGIGAYALSIVDTYGLLVPHELVRLYALMDAWLDDGVMLGFHGHDNGHLAFANCIALLAERGARDLLLDGTLLGMGKSAGNAPTELLASYLNKYEGERYEIAPLVDAIERYIASWRGAYGYALPYFLASATGTHPAFASHLLSHGMRAGEVYGRLRHVPHASRLSFDERVLCHLCSDEVKR